MDTSDFELYKGKSFASLCKDVVNNSEEKKQQIDILITDLRDMIKTVNDAVTIVPLLKEYMELGIKNDDAFIKMAGIVQRAMNASLDPSDAGLLSERDKELLFQEINNVTAPIEPKRLEANNN